MGDYYLAMCRVYGSYLFCLYFEFFGQFLRLNQEEKSAVRELRKYLLSLPRWPEMITFEEMNIDVSRPTFSSMLLYAIDDPKNKKLDGLCLRFYFPYRLSEDSVQLHQAYNGSCNHREQPRSQAIIFAKDAPSFDATDAVFHINTLLGYLPVLQTLF